MFGELGVKDRRDWRDDYETGEQVSTLYKGTWVKGVVKGKGVKDLLKVDVLPNEQTGAFVGRLTTKDGVRKAS